MLEYSHGPWTNQHMVGYLNPRSNHYRLRYLGPGLTSTCKEIWALAPAHHRISGPGARKGSRCLGPVHAAMEEYWAETDWAMGTKEVKYCMVRKSIFCTGPTCATKAKQKYLILYRHDEPIEPTKEGPVFVSTPWVPIWHSFNSQQGPPFLSSLSGTEQRYLFQKCVPWYMYFCVAYGEWDKGDKSTSSNTSAVRFWIYSVQSYSDVILHTNPRNRSNILCTFAHLFSYKFTVQ
jgi:hypothetical protein